MSLSLHYFQKRHARALSLYIHKEKLSRNYIEKQKSTLSYIRTSNFRLWLAFSREYLTKNFQYYSVELPLREKCPNTELFLVRIFQYSVFSPNTGKYGPDITPYLDTIQAMSSIDSHDSLKNYF